MNQPFIPPTDSHLNEVSEEVPVSEIRSEETQAIIEKMLDIAFGNTRNKNKSVLVGLAAPQIGIQKRIILVDLAATGVYTRTESPPPPQIEVFINPQIIWSSDETIPWREACFSTGRIMGIVYRPARIIVQAYDREGNPIKQEFSGYTARIFQHEIDHLHGIRFPDRIQKDEDLHWVEEAEIVEYRIVWPSWPKKCPREKWTVMKNGSSN